MKIVTFNIRHRWDNDGINSFIHRIGFIYEKIMAELPEIIGFQEVKPKELVVLERLFPEYWIVGHGRDPDFGGEGLYTAIRKDSCQLIGMDAFWYGPDIYDPATRYPGQSHHPRKCVSTLLRHIKSGRMLRIYNTHMDNSSSEVVTLEVECLLNKLREDCRGIRAETVVLGDFNEVPQGDALQRMRSSGDPMLTDLTADIPYTYHEFGNPEKFVKIDYIFVSQELRATVQSVSPWTDTKNGIFLSDHYPVCAEFRF